MLIAYTSAEGYFVTHEIPHFNNTFEDYKKAFDLLFAPVGKTFDDLYPNTKEILHKLANSTELQQ